jgi:hypothetical protein
MKKLILSIILTVCFAGAISAQGGYPAGVYISGSGRERTAAETSILQRVYDGSRNINRSETMRAVANNDSYGGSVMVSQYSNELASKAKKYIVPTRELKNKYSDFLKLPDAGIITLVEETACVFSEDKKDKGKDIFERCPSTFIPGGGRYFSFRKNDYVKSGWADIGFMDKWIYSFGWFNQSALVNLGDVPLEDVSLKSKGVDYFAQYAPPTDIKEADRQFREFEKGLEIDGLTFKQMLPLELDKTYALRVTAYEADLEWIYKFESKDIKIHPLKGDKREDVIIAFRIVGKDEKGNLTLLWRELQRTKAPVIIIPKSETDKNSK